MTASAPFSSRRRPDTELAKQADKLANGTHQVASLDQGGAPITYILTQLLNPTNVTGLIVIGTLYVDAFCSPIGNTDGLLTLQCLKARGAGRVTVIDIQNDKLLLAQKLGADEMINPAEINLSDHFRERAPQAVFETAGTPVTQRQSLEIVSKLGKVVFVGTAEKPVEFPPKTFERILRGELELTGSWMSYSAPYPGYEWETAIRYLQEKKVRVREMITHRFRLEDGLEAFRTMRNPDIGTVKVMFELDQT